MARRTPMRYRLAMSLALDAARRMARALPKALGGGLLGIVWLPYFTWVLTPADLGLVGLTLCAARLIEALGSFKVEHIYAQRAAGIGPAERLALRNGAITFTGINFAAVLVAAAVLAVVAPAYAWVFVLAPILAAARFPAALFAVDFAKVGTARVARMLASGRTILGIGVMIVLISGFGLSWEGRAIALIAAEGAIAVLCWCVLTDTARRFRPWIGRGMLPLFVLAGAPVVGRWVGLWALENADRFIALEAFTLAVVGYYVAAARIASLVLAVNRALAGSLQTLFHELAADPARRGALIRLYTAFSALGLALAAGAAALFHANAGVILGPRFHGAGPVIALVILAAGCYGAFQAGWLVRGFYPLTAWSGLKTYIALALQVAVTIALLPFLGVLAPAAGDVVGRTAASGIMSWAAFSCVGRLPLAARGRAGVEPRDDDL